MKKHSIFLTTVFISLSSYSQSNSTTKIRALIALWAETLWSYNFKLDSKYQFETSGHFGNIITKGLYKIIQHTIILTAFPKRQQVEQLALLQRWLGILSLSSSPGWKNPNAFGTGLLFVRPEQRYHRQIIAVKLAGNGADKSISKDPVYII